MTMRLIRCDRCMEEVQGYIDDTNLSSAGVYVTRPEMYWSKFANEGESVVCDECMWADPRYIAVYGPVCPLTNIDGDFVSERHWQ